MKKLLQILAIVLLPFVYFTVMGSITGEGETPESQTSSYKPTGVQSYLPSFKDEFVNIIFNKGYTGDSIFVTHRLDKIKNILHFNGTQNYFYQDGYYGNHPDTPLTQDRIDRMNSLIELIDNNDLKGIYNRNKIADAIINSQRVIYEVSSGGSTTENYGFCWQDVNTNTGSYTIDQGRTVLKCSTGVNSAGVLCDNIYENLQHSDKLGEWGWSDTRYMWHLKPVMRIDTAIFNPLDATPVAGIIIKNFKGELMDSIVIRVKNFANDTGHYAGEYIRKFTFQPNPPHPDTLTFSADTSTGINIGWEDVMNSNNMIDKTCKVDFEIYWYGLVDVWFDQLIVDNEHADLLFNHDLDSNIIKEVSNFWSDKNYFFFTDELHPSNVSSAKYVYDLAKSVPGASDVRMSYALTNYFNERGVRREYPLSFKMMFDSVDSEVFTLDVHEVNSWNLLPNSLTGHPSPYYPHPDWFQSYNEYNNYLQKKVLGDKSEATGRTPESSWSTTYQGDLPAPRGSLIYQVRKARDMSDSIAPNTKMIVQPQIHSGVFRYLTSNTYDKYSHQREPTNQEIEAQAVIALSHGADGLCWFIYDSFSIDFSTGVLHPVKEFTVMMPCQLQIKLDTTLDLRTLHLINFELIMIMGKTRFRM